MSLIRKLMLLPLAGLLGACGALPVVVQPWPGEPAGGGEAASPAPPSIDVDQPPLTVPEAPAVVVEQSAAPTSLPAVARMHELAGSAAERGEHAQAIALLERALRISPRDPQTYYELARHHCAAGQPARGLQLAERGLSLSPTPGLRERLTGVAGDCRQALSA